MALNYCKNCGELILHFTSLKGAPLPDDNKWIHANGLSICKKPEPTEE